MPHYHTSEEDIPSEEDDSDLNMDLGMSDTDTDYYQNDRSYHRRRIVRFPPLAPSSPRSTPLSSSGARLST